MSGIQPIAAKSALTSLILCGVIAAATVPSDLSKYRGFQFGTDLPAVARQAGASVSQAKVVHSRPALIQELEWRPQSLGPSTQKESAGDVVFSFYNGELYRIEVKYDRYAIEGLTAEDIIGAVSAIYGPATQLAPPDKPAENQYGDKEEVVGRWQDSLYCFDLIRSSYGPAFRLVGVLKKVDSPAQAAIQEAQRLDLRRRRKGKPPTRPANRP